MPSYAEFGNDLYTGKRSIDFVGRRNLWYLLAVLGIALSVVGVGIRVSTWGSSSRAGRSSASRRPTPRASSSGRTPSARSPPGSR